MNAYEFWRLYHKGKHQTHVVMRRYRLRLTEHVAWTEAELRSAWGDR